MFVRGIDLREVTLIEEGAEGVRVTFVNGDRKFIDGDDAVEILERWRLDRRLAGKVETVEDENECNP